MDEFHSRKGRHTSLVTRIPARCSSAINSTTLQSATSTARPIVVAELAGTDNPVKLDRTSQHRCPCERPRERLFVRGWQESRFAASSRVDQDISESSRH